MKLKTLGTVIKVGVLTEIHLEAGNLLFKLISTGNDAKLVECAAKLLSFDLDLGLKNEINLETIKTIEEIVNNQFDLNVTTKIRLI